jgi:transcriptional regulator with XRE-family HTH domain
VHAADLLKRARSDARLTQRELAGRVGMPQSAVARIESGAADVRVATLDRLLRACDAELTLRPRPGRGVDRSLIRAVLRLAPGDRFDAAVAAARLVDVA